MSIENKACEIYTQKMPRFIVIDINKDFFS